MSGKLLSGGLMACLVLLALSPAATQADPCLIVYPDAATLYHYEAAEYYTVGPGDPLYDPAFDRGGEVLIDINTDEIAENIYQAPGLVGFVLDNENQGYFINSNNYNLIVDGFSNAPTVYTNVLIVFDLIEPTGCVPAITVDGNPVLFDPGLGYYYPIGDFVVVTPSGSHFSDTQTFAIAWGACIGYRVWAFSDEDGNLQRDGNECKTAFSHDLAVPTADKTWGAVKSLFRD